VEQWFRVIWATTAGIVAMTAFGAAVTLLGIDATGGPQTRSVPFGLYVFLAAVFLLGAYSFVAALKDSPKWPLPGASASRQRALDADFEAWQRESSNHASISGLENSFLEMADAMRGNPESPPKEAPLHYQIAQARQVLEQLRSLGETFDSPEFKSVWDRTQRDGLNPFFEPLPWEIVVVEVLPELVNQGELEQMDNGRYRFPAAS
jgi:hypothetical protein